jgi:glycerophosphoryl diester phosphodiesterase
MEEGADGVELDVRLDGDGRVIVLHDRTLGRVTSGADPRDVETVRAEELGTLDVGKGERVPLLLDVLEWARRRGARVNIELKKDVSRRRDLVRGVVRLVRDSVLERDALIFSSFDPAIVFALSRLVGDVPTAWLVHDGQRVFRDAPAHGLLGARAVHPQVTLANEARITAWKGARLVVNVWTVNDPTEARRLSALGVDGLISDTPGAILRALAQ